MLLTKVKLGRIVEDLQDILVLDEEPGPLRANRVDIEGIGQACTLQQGLGLRECEEIAALAIAAAISALSKWKKQIPESSMPDITRENMPQGAPTPTYMTGELSRGSPVNTRLLLEHIEVWWGIKGEAARRLLQLAEDELERQPENTSWMDLRFGEAITRSIANFERVSDEMQRRRLTKTRIALSRKDFAELLHALTTQLLLIAFLGCQAGLRSQVRGRGSAYLIASPIGQKIKGTKEPEALCPSDVMYSWHLWVHGSFPQESDD